MYHHGREWIFVDVFKHVGNSAKWWPRWPSRAIYFQHIAPSNVAPAHNHDRIWWLICFDNFDIYIYMCIWYNIWDIWYVYRDFKISSVAGYSYNDIFWDRQPRWVNGLRKNWPPMTGIQAFDGRQTWVVFSAKRRDLGVNDEWTTIFRYVWLFLHDRYDRSPSKWRAHLWERSFNREFNTCQRVT